MSDQRISVEPGIDGTRIRAPRPGRTNPGRGLLVLGGAVALWFGIAWLVAVDLGGQPLAWANHLGPVVVVAGLVTALAGLVVMRLRPPEPTHYAILLTPRGVEIDGERMEHDVKMVLHDEKLVFRDSRRQVEVWHGVRDLEQRMELRSLLERALDASADRHGQGQADVPDALVRARQPER